MLHLRHILIGAAGLLAVSALSQSARAQTWYTDRAAWQAAVTGTQTTTFEGLAPIGGYVNYSTPAGATINSLNFVGHPTEDPGGTRLYVDDASYFPMYFDWGSGAVMLGKPGSITVSFLNPAVRSFGFDFFGIDPLFMSHAFTGDFNVDGHAYRTAAAASKTRNFLGYVGSAPLSTLSYTSDPAMYLMLDNFSTATGRSGLPNPIVEGSGYAVVPEPASLALVATGILGLGLVGRKRRPAA